MHQSARSPEGASPRAEVDRRGAVGSGAETAPDERLTPSEPLPPAGHALLSVLVPGLGQLAQRRPLTAALQFGTVATYAVSAYALGGGRALWLAVLWNGWSALEAYWHARR